MNIQSISICVPAPRCVNKCAFCVSRMHTSTYPDRIMDDSRLSLAEEDYIKRLEYARDNGCNTVILTGQVEPQQNKRFLEKFYRLNQSLKSPFKNIEMQTTGTLLNEEYLKFLRETVGVTTISISISSLTSNMLNNEIIGTPPNGFIHLSDLCHLIKKMGFNLRLSLNVTSALVENEYPSINGIFTVCKHFGADQITFRKMYSSGTNTSQDKWIKEHQIKEDFFFSRLDHYIKEYGNYIDTLEYGNKRYSVNEMSVVVDDDCMAKSEEKQTLKYVILRPNCKLYSKWDDKGSLIF